MKKLLYFLVVGVLFTSCQKEEFEIPTNYQFEMTGRTSQDINGYYHLPLNPQENTCLPFLNNLSTRILEKDYYSSSCAYKQN